MEQKQIWINYLRAFATIAVIIIHVSSEMLFKYEKIPNSHWWISLLFNSGARFCIPVFFMISGSLLLQKDELIKQFLTKRLLKIIPPFIFWSIIYTLYDSYIVSHQSFDFWKILQKIGAKLLHGSQYHLWFVYTLLGIYLMIPILRKWVKYASIKEIQYFLIIWLGTFLYTLPGLKSYLPAIDLVNFTGYLGYIVLGYYLNQISIVNRTIPIIFLITSLAFTICGTYGLTATKQKFDGLFLNGLTFNVMAYAVSVFLLLKNVEIQSVWLNKILNFIGIYSFGIYLVHVLVIKILNIEAINWKMMHPLLSIPLTSFICLSLSALIIYFLRKVKYLNFIAG